ncbi:hypothetical protein DRW48_12420 [Paracoccus suum]|uniref:Uncharacterized protein n=1 Tax=Paracoccus suum TaxID=2259340 RepID=A0A344PLX9_9RHOB|nr:hypothetical protein [Paracoccus suum]AXC50384.1 hypothetical protein DRW48_12420 [Paracoccus suum]
MSIMSVIPLGRPVDIPDTAQPSKRLQAFCDLIAAEVAAHPFELDGRIWAMLPRKEWAVRLQVEVKTVSRLSQQAPIERLDTGRKGANGTPVRMLALRVMLPGEKPVGMSHRHMANIMRKMFESKTGRTLGNAKWGMLKGLAETWPEGHQLTIFADALGEWPFYAAGVKARIEFERDAYGTPGTVRFYRYPSVSVMRRWPNAVADAYLTRWQSKNSGKGLRQPFDYHHRNE